MTPICRALLIGGGLAFAFALLMAVRFEEGECPPLMEPRS